MNAFWFALALLAQVPSGSTGVPDSVRVLPPGELRSGAGGLTYSVGDFVLRDAIDDSRRGYLAVSLNRRSMQWYRPPTRFDAVLTGAGAAATLGMFVGAVGTSLGWFGEDAAWVATGVMAAAGAVYGNASYQMQPRLGLSQTSDR